MTEPASLFTVHTERHGDRSVVVVTGEFDMSGSPLFEAEVRRAEATDVKRIIIDLSAVTFMDSSGLKSLLQAQARSQADSNRVRLVRPPRRVQRVFEVTNTEGMLPFLD